MIGNELFSLDQFIFGLLNNDATLLSLVGAVNQKYAVNVGLSTGGTFTLTALTFTTAPIAYNASAATVQTAANLAFGAATVTVTGAGSIAAPWIVEFTGLPHQPVAMSGSGFALIVLAPAVAVLTVTETVRGQSFIFAEAAPQGTPAPYVIVGFLSNTETTVIGAVRIITRPLYCIKAITQENTWFTADAISHRVDALMMGSRGTSNGLNVACTGREAMVRTYEMDQGLRFNYLGGTYRWFVS